MRPSLNETAIHCYSASRDTQQSRIPHHRAQDYTIQTTSVFLCPLLSVAPPSSLQEIRGINKPIGTQIVNHYLDPWSVYVDKGYNLAALCIIFLGRLRFWFFPPLCNNQMCPMSPGTHSSLGGGFCCCCPQPAPPPPLMPEWFPAAAPVLDQPWSTSPPAGGGHI